MNQPTLQTVSILKDLHSAAQELELHGRYGGEWTPLKAGDRVVLLSPEGDYLATVECDWEPSEWPAADLVVRLDVRKDVVVGFHRTMFREHSVLDRLAEL